MAHRHLLDHIPAKPTVDIHGLRFPLYYRGDSSGYDVNPFAKVFPSKAEIEAGYFMVPSRDMKTGEKISLGIDEHGYERFQYEPALGSDGMIVYVNINEKTGKALPYIADFRQIDINRSFDQTVTKRARVDVWLPNDDPNSMLRRRNITVPASFLERDGEMVTLRLAPDAYKDGIKVNVPVEPYILDSDGNRVKVPVEVREYTDKNGKISKKLMAPVGYDADNQPVWNDGKSVIVREGSNEADRLKSEGCDFKTFVQPVRYTYEVERMSLTELKKCIESRTMNSESHFEQPITYDADHFVSAQDVENLSRIKELPSKPVKLVRYGDFRSVELPSDSVQDLGIVDGRPLIRVDLPYDGVVGDGKVWTDKSLDIAADDAVHDKIPYPSGMPLICKPYIEVSAHQYKNGILIYDPIESVDVKMDLIDANSNKVVDTVDHKSDMEVLIYNCFERQSRDKASSMVVGYFDSPYDKSFCVACAQKVNTDILTFDAEAHPDIGKNNTMYGVHNPDISEHNISTYRVEFGSVEAEIEIGSPDLEVSKDLEKEKSLRERLLEKYRDDMIEIEAPKRKKKEIPEPDRPEPDFEPEF